MIAISRRNLLCACGCLGAAAFLAGRPAFAAEGSEAAAHAGHVKTTLTAKEALARLKQGNDDFVADRPAPRISDRERRLEIAKDQSPFCVLVGCSDSRVSPELLFGRGLGELFIVRVAGNTVDTAALGSIEYGVAALGCPLVLVLGHERCGAVDAAVKMVTQGARYTASIEALIAPILPAVIRAERDKPDDLLATSVAYNVERVVAQLRSSRETLTEPFERKEIDIVGAVYDLDDGAVRFSA